MRVYQSNIFHPTLELTAQALNELTESLNVNESIANYRMLKNSMAQAEAQQQVDALVKQIVASEAYQKWLDLQQKKDEKRTQKRLPAADLNRVRMFIGQLKTTLPAVIPTAVFEESVNQYGNLGRWRVQTYCQLTGLAVLDADHVPNPEELIREWMARDDFATLGIVWIYITPSGKGIKVVFKAREEWGNLQDNAYTMAETLGVLDYADAACKNADHAHFIPRKEDIKFIDVDTFFSYENPAYEKRFGAAYRQGESEPTQQRWQEFEKTRKEARQGGTKAVKQADTAPTAAVPAELTEREKRIVEALNGHYGDTLAEGTRHQTWIGETAPWLLLLTDNNAGKVLAMGRQLNYVKNWTDQSADELENCVATVRKKPLLTARPKRLRELLDKAGIDTDNGQTGGNPEDMLPFDEWVGKISNLFDVYPCIREICEPHPSRLWPFLLFASAALMGSLMTLTWFHFYDEPEKRRRLNYNVLGIGDPASGKGALVRIAALLTEPIEQADQMANDAINEWKEQQSSKGQNRDKAPKPKAVVRLHGPRTSNNIFINDMMNAWADVEGERMQMHMLTVETEALNSIKLQKGGSWIDKQVMEIKAWSNEKDSQQYANLDSMTGFFNVFWNQVRTCTPPALDMMANDRNFGTGWPTRVSAIPILGTGFKMIELRKQSQKALDADETVRKWAYKLDKRQGELPLWPLVEHAWHWAANRMEVAAFNNDMADELLLKRCPATALCLCAPLVDMRHWDEREESGTYATDATDEALLDLILDIQYRTQHYHFGVLAYNYFEKQLHDPTRFRRRTSHYEECFQKLPDAFTTEQFTKVFGFANSHSAAKAIERLMSDKAIERTKRGEYVKRVQSIS